MAERKGTTINSYLLLQDFTAEGGGNGEYSFVEKNGKEYFIKKFLDPVYPRYGNAETKQKGKIKCESFERRHKKIQKMLSDKSTQGGNLIITKDFFRHNLHYYKITDKVDITPLEPKKVCSLDHEIILLFLSTLTNSINILHSEGIVHGDLKPENILIHKKSADVYVAKLIDFDNSFFTKNPPTSSEVVGEFQYYSPELGSYVENNPSIKSYDLSSKSDIFALGLLFHLYLTGHLPRFRTTYNYPFENVTSGDKPILDDFLPVWMNMLIIAMLQADYHMRPDIETVFRSLKDKKEPSSTKEIPTKKLKGDLAKLFS